MEARERFEKEIREELKLYKEVFGTDKGFKEYFKRKVEREVKR